MTTSLYFPKEPIKFRLKIAVKELLQSTCMTRYDTMWSNYRFPTQFWSTTVVMPFDNNSKFMKEKNIVK